MVLVGETYDRRCSMEPDPELDTPRGGDLFRTSRGLPEVVVV